MASNSIKLKATAGNGETTVKALIKHPMETGRRKDKATGELVPAITSRRSPADTRVNRY